MTWAARAEAHATPERKLGLLELVPIVRLESPEFI